MRETNKKALTLKALNKSNVWDLQENDIFRLWEAAEKDAEVKDNMRHYLDIARSAFDMEKSESTSPKSSRNMRTAAARSANCASTKAPRPSGPSRRNPS